MRGSCPRFAARRNPALAAVVLTLLASAASFPPQPSSTLRRALAQAPAAPRDAAPLPAPGQRVERELAPGQSHFYEVALAANQLLGVSVETRGADVSLALAGASGRALAAVENRRGRAVTLSIVAAEAGPYALEVRSLERGAAAGSYTLRVETLRDSEPRDAHLLAAERARAEGERLRLDGRADSVALAAARFEDAAAEARSAGDARAEADALRAAAESRQRAGDSRAAESHYRRALELSRRARDLRAESETLNGLGYLLLFRGDFRAALRLCEQARALARAARDPRAEAAALVNVGECFYWLNDSRRAVARYRDALTLWDALADRRGRAQVLLSLGQVYSDLGEVRSADEHLDAALALSEEVGDARARAATLTAKGRLRSRTGDSQEALDFFARAMQALSGAGDFVEEASTLNGMGYVYDELGNKQAALDCYTNALALFRRAGHRHGEPITLHEIGRVHFSLGNHEQALADFRTMLALSRELNDRRAESYALRSVGMVYDALGEREHSLAHYEKALRLQRAGRDRRGESYTLNLIGRVEESRGARRLALEHYRRALPLSRAAQFRFVESLTLYNMARVERDEGRLEEARSLAADALRVAETLRTKVDSQELRASYFASVRLYHELHIDVLMRLDAARPGTGFAGAALEASERARARSMLETLREARVRLRQGAAPALLERERALQQALDAKADRQTRLSDDPDAGAERAALAKEIGQLSVAYDEVRARIRATSPRYAALTQPRPLGLDEIRREVLDDETLLLEYALGDERSYLWAVSRESVKAFVLPPRAEVERVAVELRELLIPPTRAEGERADAYAARLEAAGAEYRRRADALSNMLVRPAAALLEDKRLLVVADGALQYIPFQLLPAPADERTTEDGRTASPSVERTTSPHGDDDGAALLLDRHEIVNLASASTLAVLRAEAPRRETSRRAVAVLADPVFESDDPRLRAARAADAREDGRANEPREGGPGDGDENAPSGGGALSLLRGREGAGVPPRLPASGDEAQAIMEVTPEGSGLLAVGFDASKRTVESAEFRRYPVIHFATHGILNSEHPELSGLALSRFDARGRPLDGTLRLHDIYNLDLSAELVVLSACNTALGKDVRGEGLVGLTRGFMYAGARRVVASLWKVDDEATAELMKNFYRRMTREQLSPAAALRRAQLDLRRERRWRHPYHWAAFVIQGEYEGRVIIAGGGDTTRATPAASIVAVVALALGLCALCLYLFKKLVKRKS